MSKEAVSSSHHADLEQTYGELRPATERSAIVVGAEPGNIGGAIQDSLARNMDAEGVCVNGHPTSSAFLDVANLREVEDFAWSRHDTLVLCNGRTRLDWLEDCPSREIEAVLRDTLLGSMWATQEFVRQTLDAPHLKYIVYVGSMAHGAVLNGSAAYCAAKAGLAHYARCAAWELAPKGYRVFIVHPSNTEGTPMTEETISGLERYRNLPREDAEAYWGATRALPRWLQPSDIGEVVRYLVTEPAAEWLAGAQLNLGGGTR